MKLTHLFLIGLILTALFFSCETLHAEEQWQGVDETVVGKFAREHGHEAGNPLIKAEGDMQLFAFLMAGVVGGFAAGYYWRALLEGKKRKDAGK